MTDFVERDVKYTSSSLSSSDIPIVEIIRELIATLGPTTTAILAGVNDTRRLRLWEGGASAPDQPVARLRAAWDATQWLVRSDDALIAKAWWFGANPAFHGEAPAAILRATVDATAIAHLIGAARDAATR